MKRILSVFSLLCGVGVITYLIYLMALGVFWGTFLTTNVVFLTAGATLLALGLWGSFASATRKRGSTDKQQFKPQKHYKKAAIIVGALSAGVVFYVVLPVALQMNQTGNIDAALRPMMKEDYTQTGVSLPDNAKYILYNINKQTFETDSGTLLKGISENTKQINVVVTYQITTASIGVWKTEGGAVISSAYAETMTLCVVRLSDWSLIEEKTFVAVQSENNLGKADKKYTYQVRLYDTEVVGYLNGLFGK